MNQDSNLALIGRRVVPLALVGSFALVMGALVARQPQLAVISLCMLLAIPAVNAPTAYWVGATLVAALTLKGVSTLGLLPSVAALIDIPLAWGSLFVALLHVRALSREQRLLVILLLSLLVITIMSSAFSGFDVIRGVLFLGLLGQPLAVATALIVDRPTPTERRVLERLLLGLLVVQIPITYLQFSLYGPSDNIKGSLWGAGAGHHVISGVIALGCVWIAVAAPISRKVKLLLILLLAPIPFLADAKQVILALPAVLLVTRWKNIKDVFARFSIVVIAVLTLLIAFPAGKVALNYLDDARHGRTSKQHTASFVVQKMEHNPASAVFGQGPAETVSRAAFMTTDDLLSADSPLRTLGVTPARVATEAQALGIVRLGGEVSSFESGLSSAIGILGDIGVAGLACYLGFWFVLLSYARRAGSQGTAAASGIALLLGLGLVFDWWEQPPFTVFVGVLVGLAASAVGWTPAPRR